MPLAALAFAAALQAKPACDPRLARTWTGIALQGLESATLRIVVRRGVPATFELRSRTEKSAPEETLTGRVETVPLPEPFAKKMPGYEGGLGVRFLCDLPSLARVSMDPKEIAALKRAGKTHAPVMRLVFVPSVPSLTDVMTATFLPEGDPTAAERQKRWDPFKKPPAEKPGA